MADNTILNSGTGGDTIASDDIAGIKHQRVKLSVGADGSASDAVPVSNGMDVTGAAVQAVGLVAQLDDTATGAVTENQFAPVRLSTRRALLVEGVASGTAVPISAASLPLPTSAATEATVSALAGDVGDTADAAATAGSTGTLHAKQRLMTSQLDSIKTAVETLDNAIAGSEMQVDVLTLPNVTLAAGTNTNEVVGDAAHDAAVAGNPVLVGGYASAAAPTDVSADGDVARIWTTVKGAVNIADAGGNISIDDGGNSITVDGSVSITGTPSVVVAAQMDDTATTLATENNYSAARLTEYRALHVNLRDAAGTELAVGGGTQYTEDAAAAANPVGNALNLIRADSLAGVTSADGDNVAARGTDKGELYVKHVDAIPVTDNGGSLTVDVGTALPAGTNAIGKLAANSGVDIGDVDITSIAAGDNNIGNVDIVSLPASTNTLEVVGDVAHDAAIAGNPITVGGVASAAAPADVSADQDAVRAWYLRNGAQATVITAAGALIGGDATNGLDIDVTRLPALVAGTANIGDVDVLTIAAGDNNIGNVDIVTMPNVTLAAGTNTNEVVGDAAHDAAAAGNPLLGGAYASAAAPTDVSADGDAVRLWALRSGAQVIQPTYAGVLHSTGNGVAGTGTPRVTIASDNTAFSVNIGTFPDNEPFNVAQINGVTPLMGAGNTGTGSQRVTIASDQAVIAVGGNVAHSGVDAGNPIKIGGLANANEQTAVADADRVDAWFDPIGRQVCLLGHASPEAPVTANGSAAGVSVIAAPGASLSLYICKGSLHNSAAAEAIVSLRDGAAGTIRFTANLAADGGGCLFDFGSRGWKLTANTAFVMDAASATQYCNVTEFYIAA